MNKDNKKTISTLAIRGTRPTVATLVSHREESRRIILVNTVWGLQAKDESIESAVTELCNGAE